MSWVWFLVQNNKNKSSALQWDNRKDSLTASQDLPDTNRLKFKGMKMYTFHLKRKTLNALLKKGCLGNCFPRTFHRAQSSRLSKAAAAMISMDQTTVEDRSRSWHHLRDAGFSDTQSTRVVQGGFHLNFKRRPGRQGNVSLREQHIKLWKWTQRWSRVPRELKMAKTLNIC